ncbi:Metalloenzyme, LuxS/M16 peptidase-like protein [Pavlovales sp. CCMP2436]|nr:Metalloenzyme, LuxS/M16 peptidase-like protein [Pavlovales sp. CCMP2436]
MRRQVTKNGQTQVMVHTPSNKFISATKWHQIFYDAATDVAERKDPTLVLLTAWGRPRATGWPLLALLLLSACARASVRMPGRTVAPPRVRMQAKLPEPPSGWGHKKLRQAVPRNAAAAAAAAESIERAGVAFDTALLEHPRVVRGELRNGLRYAILPNPTPVGRFEAHLELHVGSCEEADDEQGLAHLVEHVTFMGSRKRERLFSTGSKSNAYTDFHHTVYHFHCPQADAHGRALMPLAFDALREIAFEPELLSARIEKERKAILSELQMINTIDYRCSTKHLRELHSDNPLGQRFPIGKKKKKRS